MSKDFMDIIRERRSIRRFKGDPVPDEMINLLLEAACYAPSAGNLQPWLFLVVRNQEIKEKLAAAALGQRFLASAPVCIVVCAEPNRSGSRYGRRGSGLYCIQDTAAATQNILLAAMAMGLATCWIGAFDTAQVQKVLELDSHYVPVVIIPVGYSDQKPKAPPRRPLTEVTRTLI